MLARSVCSSSGQMANVRLQKRVCRPLEDGVMENLGKGRSFMQAARGGQAWNVLLGSLSWLLPPLHFDLPIKLPAIPGHHMFFSHFCTCLFSLPGMLLSLLPKSG